MPSYHYLYLSQLSPGNGHEVVPRVAAAARQRNATLGVAGVLLFDGQRFCQLLRGPQAGVAEVMASIARDPRHHDLVTLTEAWLTTANAVQGLVIGYVDEAALDAFDPSVAGADAVLRGEAAVRALLQRVERADLSV